MKESYTQVIMWLSILLHAWNSIILKDAYLFTFSYHEWNSIEVNPEVEFYLSLWLFFVVFWRI
jgi:hypothetical protein